MKKDTGSWQKLKGSREEVLATLSEILVADCGYTNGDILTMGLIDLTKSTR
jgi:hypothetical protein